MPREQEDIARIVQQLFAKADDKATPAGERAALLEKATQLMAKYAIDDLLLAKGNIVADDVIMSDIRLATMDEVANSPIIIERMEMATLIARNTRCQPILRTFHYDTLDQNGNIVRAGKYLTVIGFRSDVSLVRSLYMALLGSFIEALLNEPTGKLGKRDKVNYERNFASGWNARINERLRKARRETEKMAETGEKNLLPVLRRRESAVEEFVANMFPNLSTVRVNGPRPDSNAFARGGKAADKADLGTSKKVGGSGASGEVGSGNKELGEGRWLP